MDKSFGVDGFGRFTAQLSNRGGSKVNTMLVQPDGKIVLCGAADSYDLALVKFNSTGEIDTAFGDLKGYTVLRRDIGGAIGKSVFIRRQIKSC